MMGDEQRTQAGIKGLETMFAYRDAETGFPFPDGNRMNADDRQQSKLLTEAFFMMELLQCWHISQFSGFGRRFTSDIRIYVDIMEKEARVIQNEIDELIVSNLHAANRVIICLRLAALLRFAYSMQLPIGRYIRAVTSLQTKDGYFLERHGADVSYNAASVLFASQTLFVLQSEPLKAAVTKSVAWLNDRVSDVGELLPHDDTRTAGQETGDGKPKGPNFAEITQALVLGAALTGHVPMLSKARAIWRQIEQH